MVGEHKIRGSRSFTLFWVSAWLCLLSQLTFLSHSIFVKHGHDLLHGENHSHVQQETHAQLHEHGHVHSHDKSVETPRQVHWSEIKPNHHSHSTHQHGHCALLAHNKYSLKLLVGVVLSSIVPTETLLISLQEQLYFPFSPKFLFVAPKTSPPIYPV